MSEQETYCLLEKKRAKKERLVCSPSDCATCGWNKRVADKRKKQLRENGLTLCKDGYYRLGGDGK